MNPRSTLDVRKGLLYSARMSEYRIIPVDTRHGRRRFDVQILAGERSCGFREFPTREAAEDFISKQDTRRQDMGAYETARIEIERREAICLSVRQGIGTDRRSFHDAIAWTAFIKGYPRAYVVECWRKGKGTA